jgi:hypothetical protein
MRDAAGGVSEPETTLSGEATSRLLRQYRRDITLGLRNDCV